MDQYQQQPYYEKLPAAYHTMLERCVAWAEGRYRGMNAKAFAGPALGPRRDLLMWGDDDSSDTLVEVADFGNELDKVTAAVTPAATATL